MAGLCLLRRLGGIMVSRVLLLTFLTCGLPTGWGAADPRSPQSPPEAVAAEVTTPDDNALALTATYLLNLAWFVSWPDTALGGPDEPLRIGVLGHPDLVATATELATSQRVRRRPVHVQALTVTDEITSYHILFVSQAQGDNGRLEDILASVSGLPCLTVGEQDDFIQRGGHIKFVPGQGATSLKINRVAAEAAGLRISSKLLSLAEIVSTDETAEKD